MECISLITQINPGYKEGRAEIRRLEKLYSLGGFVRQLIDDMLVRLFSAEILETVREYYEIGNDFWSLADILQYETCWSPFKLYSNEKNRKIAASVKYRKWYFHQIARCYFDMEGRIKYQTRLEGSSYLNPLQERIICYLQGINVDHAMSEEEIAQLYEFACDTEYIALVSDEIHSNMKEPNVEEFI